MQRIKLNRSDLCSRLVQVEIFKIYHLGKLFYKNHKETYVEALLRTNLMDYVFGLMAPSFLYKAMLQSEILAPVK